MNRREVFGAVGKAMTAAALVPGLQTVIVSCAMAADEAPLHAIAGVDRVTILPGKTYIRGWAGYGDPVSPRGPQAANPVPTPAPAGPEPAVAWNKQSGPGEVKFEDPKALITTATFTTPGAYVLKLTADNGQTKSSSTFNVSVETPPPAKQLEAVYTKNFKINSKFWNARAKTLIGNWIPHCIDIINRSDVTLGPGGIDNFVEAGKKLRGETAAPHKGYVFSNAWVHQTVEAMSIALMIDPQGDPEILAARAKFRATLEDWIPKIIAAQEPDGYLQTAFTLDRAGRAGAVTESSKFQHWDPRHRGDHEGYVAGYFLESAINHYLMTGKKDARMYNAAKKLADCWYNHLGPAPKTPWYDGHQEMEQALVRFGRFVNDMEGGGKGDPYVQTARNLLDARYTAAVNPARDRSEYDQSHLPVTQQYEAVGHAVRATYTYSGMADVAVETHDPDYQSAVRSLWENVVNKKYYLTGGIGSGETSEGFGPNYSLRNNAYCESCSSCGMIFFHWKMNLAYHDAKYVDNYEETMYNALLGSTDLEGKNFYYTNPLDASMGRSSWHVCPCCVGNIPRTLLMVPTWSYAKAPDGVYVNMYIGSTITLENAAGTDIEMVQDTDYPWSGKISVTVNPKTSKNFTVRLRIPNRTTSQLYRPTPEVNGLVSLAVNGKSVKPVIEKGYAAIKRTWKAGDKIELELPMKVQRVEAVDRIASTRGKMALRFGPMIYNIERADQDITKTIAPNSPLTTEWRGDLLGGVTTIKGEFADRTPLLAVPNYARVNREKDLPPEAGPLAADPSFYLGPNARQPGAPPVTAAQQGQRRVPRPAASIIWIQKA